MAEIDQNKVLEIYGNIHDIISIHLRRGDNETECYEAVKHIFGTSILTHCTFLKRNLEQEMQSAFEDIGKITDDIIKIEKNPNPKSS